jgi:hypothetical protein
VRRLLTELRKVLRASPFLLGKDNGNYGKKHE